MTRILMQIGETKLVYTDKELIDAGRSPPQGFVRSALRACWVHPDLAEAERRNVRADKQVF